MVKNTHGGNKSKGMKKIVKKAIYYDELDEGQLFGQVTKALGNLHFTVLGHDCVERIGRASNKIATVRDKKIVSGDYIIISIRTFETEKDDKKKCDILGFARPPDHIIDIFKKNSKYFEKTEADDILFETDKKEIEGDEDDDTEIDITKI